MGTQATSSNIEIELVETVVVRPTDLAERARTFATASRSTSTLTAYQSDWRHFAAWDGRARPYGAPR